MPEQPVNVAIIKRNSIVRFRDDLTSGPVPQVLMSENILQRLQESQERFFKEEHSAHLFLQNILQFIHDGVLFINLDGMLLIANHAARKILSQPLPETLPTRFVDIFPDEFFGFSMKEALNFGISHKLIYRSYPPKELEIATSFFSQGTKSSHGLFIFLRDQTEKHRQQTIIHRDERIKKLGEMVATITHEIQNPLGGIRGYASLLYRDLSKQKSLQEMALYIQDATKALERLVSRILQYARPISLQIQSIEISQFLKQLIKFIKTDPACPKNIHWELHIPDTPLIAPIDQEVLKSALFNLLLNAFQAMPLGGTLTLSLLKTGSCYQIAISDTGIGMNEEQLKRIFSPFFTTKEKGNGLGLAEVQKIVGAHYGKIDVRSMLSKGTTFTLSLPLKRD
jgi:signal transduction histidine kinase